MSNRTVTDRRGVQAPRLSLRTDGTRRGATLRTPSDTPSRTLLFLPLLALFLAGCGESPGYPDHLQHAAREDRIVIRVPTIEVDALEPAGELDAHLAGIDAKGGQTFDPTELLKETRSRIQATLLPMFGTPADPLVTGNAGIDAEAATLNLHAKRLSQGSVLFRRHCQQCHGTNGDGRGPTGLWIQPHPRDFRSGKFKYLTTADPRNGKPSRDDLTRTIRDGLKGTSMPSFSELAEADRDAIIGYVMHLSLRGQVERQLLLDEIEANVGEQDYRARAERLLAKYLADWKVANVPFRVMENTSMDLRKVTIVDDKVDAEAIRRGYSLFTDSNGVGCLKCHVDFGRRAKYRYDDWGTLVKPMDLTQGVYRGGGRADDHYHRIRCGIAPSGMPSAEKLSEDQLWDLVHFVQALPFPRLLPRDVRERIYPE